MCEVTVSLLFLLYCCYRYKYAKRKYQFIFSFPVFVVFVRLLQELSTEMQRVRSLPEEPSGHFCVDWLRKLQLQCPSL